MTTQTTPRLAYFKCNTCLTPMAVELQVRSAKFNTTGTIIGACSEELARTDAYYWGEKARCSCGGTVSLMGLVSKFNNRHLVTTQLECPCNEKCASAVGPNCSCSCGGKFHGTNAVVAVVIGAGGAPVLQAPEAAAKTAAEFLAARAAAGQRYAARHAQTIALRSAGVHVAEDAYWAWEADRRELARACGLRTHKGRLAAMAKVCA
jgi:hypothetical protein